MSHPKRADAFKEWSRMMLEQAVVPDRLQYKGTSTSSKTPKASKKRKRSKRRKKRNAEET